MWQDVSFKRVVFGTLILIVVLFAGSLLYLRDLATQTEREVAETAARVKSLKPTPVETQNASAAETGHVHADGTWHAGAHSPAEQSPVADTNAEETWRDGVWYPENYTQADIAADLAGRGAMTDEEYDRRAYKYAVNSYMQKHRETYPDCTEHAAVLADAKRYAAWQLADQAITDKKSELTAENDYLMKQLESLFKKYNFRHISEATHIPESERRNDIEITQVIFSQLEENTQRRNALNYDELIYPKPSHTH